MNQTCSLPPSFRLEGGTVLSYRASEEPTISTVDFKAMPKHVSSINFRLTLENPKSSHHDMEKVCHRELTPFDV